MLSPTFRSFLLRKLKLQLNQINQLPKYQSLLDDVWKKPWVVYCKPPFGNAQHIVKYLGQYSHRVAISNHRIKNISDSEVTFFYKDYKDESKVKWATLSGVEFLRRFCMHILPKRFVKIRYYGILSTKQKDSVKSFACKKAGNKSQRNQDRNALYDLPGLITTCARCVKQASCIPIELLPRSGLQQVFYMQQKYYRADYCYFKTTRFDGMGRVCPKS